MSSQLEKAVHLGNRDTIQFLSVRYLVYFFLFFLSLYLFVNVPVGSDLWVHTRIIEQLDQGKLVVPHFLYHLMVLVVSRISQISFQYTSCLVLACCTLLSMGLVEWILRNSLKEKYSDYFLLFVAFSLMLVSAIYFPLVNKYPYLGIWSPNPWHNPTFIAAKPFVLLSTYLYVQEIFSERPFEKRFSLMRISILLVVCALIKPNFVLAFIPVSMLVCVFLPGRRIQMLVKTARLLLPLFAVLVFQYLFMYYYDVKGASSIRFCLFDVWYYHAKSVTFAVLQATAFPLTVSILMFPWLKKDKPLLFSWALFFAALLIFSLLRETGGRERHANFAWTYMFCLNILMIFSTVFFLRVIHQVPENGKMFRIKLLISNSAFCLHLFSGIYYIGYLASGYAY